MSVEEDTAQARKRRRRNKIYQVILIIVGLESLYLSLKSPSTALNEWPPDLADRSAYCRLESYKDCREGQWFGILKSRAAANPGLLKEVCQDWGDKPAVAGARMIETADGDILYLCKMKDPGHIDPAKARF